MKHDNSTDGFHKDYGRSEMGLIPATRDLMERQGIKPYESVVARSEPIFRIVK